MPEIRLLATGDISLQVEGNPFRGIEAILNGKDILFGNLETSFFDGECKAQKAVPISSPPWKVKYLKEAGYDILNLANNHILDCGIEGLDTTLEVLQREGFHCIGAGNGKYNCSRAIINKKGISLGFLAYGNKGLCDQQTGAFINKIAADTILDDIRTISAGCDITIVSLHWGTENVYYPSPDQIKMARSFIDAGADIILGHHPHVLQGIEKYKGGLIAYSLGNFQFEYDVSQNAPTADCRTDHSVILSLRIGKMGLLSHEIIAVAIDRGYSPQLPDSRTKENIMDLMNRVSQPLSSNEVSRQRWFDWVSERYLSDSMRSWKKRIRRYGFLHFLGCCKWLVSPFVLRCCFSVIKKFFLGKSTKSIAGTGREKSNANSDARSDEKCLESVKA